MIKKIRTILFSVCAILFLLIAPTITLYSMGYRFDFESKKITQTGGFYFKVLPKNVQIFIDGKIKKKTDIFFGSILIDNLLQKKYEVQIKKEGYLPWKKTLEIKEKEVTEAKNIVLIPEKPKFETLGNEVENFFFSPDGKKMILKDREGLKLFDVEKGIKNYLIETLSKEKLEVFLFSSDSQKILVNINSKFKLFDLTEFPLSSISLDFLGPKIEEISFNPRDSLKIFFFKDGELFESDLEKKEIISLEKNILTYKITGGYIYYLDNYGFIFKTDFAQKIKDKINSLAFSVKEKVNYQLEIFGNFIFLKEGETLYLFKPDFDSFEKFFEPIKSLKISPDFEKLVYFNNHEIFLLFLEDSFNQPWKKTGEKVFLTRFLEKIGDLSWYSAHYLIFDTDSKIISGEETLSQIKIAEIDDRDGLNIYDLAEFKNPKMFFNETDKKLYILTEGKFLASERLIP